MLDVGTNNVALREDEGYVGARTGWIRAAAPAPRAMPGEAPDGRPGPNRRGGTSSKWGLVEGFELAVPMLHLPQQGGG